jgi:hypothetical protein
LQAENEDDSWSAHSSRLDKAIEAKVQQSRIISQTTCYYPSAASGLQRHQRGHQTALSIAENVSPEKASAGHLANT